MVLARWYVPWWLSARRATEPVLPLQAVQEPRVFSVCAGIELRGRLRYVRRRWRSLPLFLQVVRGISPTISGVYLLPMVLGLLITSIGSGQLVSRTGHYKIFPLWSARAW